MSKMTLNETFSTLSELMGQKCSLEGTIKARFDLQRDGGRYTSSAVVVWVELKIHPDKEDIWIEFQVVVDSPCGFTRLSTAEAAQLALHHAAAVNLAVRAENIVRGLSWSQEDTEAFFVSMRRKRLDETS